MYMVFLKMDLFPSLDDCPYNDISVV